jgi:hypothetical protein
MMEQGIILGNNSTPRAFGEILFQSDAMEKQ